MTYADECLDRAEKALVSAYQDKFKQDVEVKVLREAIASAHKVLTTSTLALDQRVIDATSILSCFLLPTQQR